MAATAAVFLGEVVSSDNTTGGMQIEANVVGTTMLPSSSIETSPTQTVAVSDLSGTFTHVQALREDRVGANTARAG
jgi:hypothetical protein